MPARAYQYASAQPGLLRERCGRYAMIALELKVILDSVDRLRQRSVDHRAIKLSRR